MQLNNDYHRDDFLKFLEEDFLTDFKRDIRPVNTNRLSSIQKANYLGESRILDLQVFEFLFEGSPNKRIALTKDAFSVMRSSAIFKALAIFHSSDNKDWRFSLMTATPEPNEKGKVSLSYSNPKRLSFFLGTNAKVNTPTKFLISKGKVVDFEDLKNRFSIEVVNKEFYKEISQAFTKLVDGLLKLPDTQEKSQKNLEFAVRLIGRIIFCWFLREKKSHAGMALMPKELLSLEAVKKNDDYYHKILEPIFFEVLNKLVKSRRDDFTEEPFSSVPYLNGGLFSPQDDDYYKLTNGDFQSQFHNTLIIPDNWFKEFFEILEMYNFTIDENTSYDEELSIDPEMLGRIFENLLAEINPETGESARKSTGSYYTPRVIVNYMVDESLLLYLKEQTGIKEDKIRAIISYDLSDDSENPVNIEEREKIVDALEKVKILDPACGSGAFPIGALQKIVFILQKTDADGQLWFKKQIKNTSPEVRRVVEREFAHKNFNYIRKLGIIRENIYGVDIQPIATEISRLRCFLTLIVDERIQDESENRGIEPLPNLDFKFVTANSLIGLPKIDLSQKSMFDDYQKIDELKYIRDQYFNASGIDREQLKTEFVMQQKRLVDQLIKEHGFMGVAKAELTQKLTDWEPFTHKSTSWFDQEWMFGIKNGFDIVIANPPYITIGGKQAAGITPDLKSLFAANYETYEYKTNSFSLFIEKAIQLISKEGGLTFIIPRTLLDNYHMQKVRKFILNKCNISELLELKYRIFDNAETGGNILFFTKGSRRLISNINKIKIKVIYNPRDLFNGNFGLIDQSEYLNSEQNRFILATDISFLLLKKIKSGSVELYDLTSIKNGVNTGNAADVLLASSNLGNKYRKILEGKNVFRYRIHWGGLWINYDPQLKSTLKVSDLKTRQSKIDFSLRSEDIFNNEKVVIRQTSDKIVATLDRDKYISRHSTHLIQIIDKKVSIKYILAVINSKVINYYYRLLMPETGKVFPEVKIVNIEKLPIKIPSKSTNEVIGKLVDNILELTKSEDYLQNLDKQTNAKEYEKQIDQEVYKIYGLTPEEIAVVERG